MVKDILTYDPFQLAQRILTGRPFSGQSVRKEAVDSEGRSWMPTCDVQETTDAFILCADVPGVDPTTIDVSTDNNILTIKGERKLDSAEEKADFNLAERVSGPFRRQFILPDTADVEKVRAQGKLGVLTVTIKKKEKAQPKKVVVDAEA